MAKTLLQLVSQIAAQRKKIEASPSKVALEKEMEETEALLDIAKAAVELHTQLHKAAPDFKEMTPALETLMVELPEKHFDHTVWIKCLRAQATFQMTYLRRLHWLVPRGRHGGQFCFPAHDMTFLYCRSYLCVSSEFVCSMVQCAYRAGEKCLVDLSSGKAYGGFP